MQLWAWVIVSAKSLEMLSKGLKTIYTIISIVLMNTMNFYCLWGVRVQNELFCLALTAMHGHHGMQQMATALIILFHDDGFFYFAQRSENVSAFYL